MTLRLRRTCDSTSQRTSRCRIAGHCFSQEHRDSSTHNPRSIERVGVRPKRELHHGRAATKLPYPNSVELEAIGECASETTTTTGHGTRDSRSKCSQFVFVYYHVYSFFFVTIDNVFEVTHATSYANANSGLCGGTRTRDLRSETYTKGHLRDSIQPRQ